MACGATWPWDPQIRMFHHLSFVCYLVSMTRGTNVCFLFFILFFIRSFLVYFMCVCYVMIFISIIFKLLYRDTTIHRNKVTTKTPFSDINNCKISTIESCYLFLRCLMCESIFLFRCLVQHNEARFSRWISATMISYMCFAKVLSVNNLWLAWIFFGSLIN